MTLDERMLERTGTATCPFVSPTPLRVVLDTNVLISLWLFADSRYLPLRAALADGRWQALANEAVLGEFARVLGYPQFGASGERQGAALAEYRGLAELVAAPAAADPLPRCRDADDQKFLELARDGRADWLVTSDKDLLRLARRQKLAHLFRILTPEAALAAIAAPSDSR